MLILLSEVCTVVRISSNVYSRNIHMLVWNCTCINNWPSYRFSTLAKQINCMKILPFIATVFMTSNIEQTTNSFLDYCPPPPPHRTHAGARAQSGDNVWDFYTHLLRWRGNLCKPWSDFSFGSRLRRVYADWSDLSFQISSQIARTQKLPRHQSILVLIGTHLAYSQC